MVDEKDDVKKGDNSGDSGDNSNSSNGDNSSSENADKSKEQTSENANQDGEKEIVFKDPEMQKAWTQKTTKLADERKAWEQEREKGKSEFEGLKKKAALLDRLDSDPEVVDFVMKKFGQKKEAEKKSLFTTEELILAQSDPEKMQELIDRASDAKVKPLNERVDNIELTSTVNAYADAEGNEDFWKLYEAGVVKPFMVTIRAENPRISKSELVKEAHLEARKLVNSIDKRAKDEANGNVQKKKEAIGDKGGKNSVSGSKSYKGKSIMDVGMDIIGNQK